jgi:conjugative transfer region protein TrbK
MPGPAPIIRGIAFGVGGIALLMAVLELMNSVTPEQESGAALEAPGHVELQRCRTLAPEQAIDDVACRDAWAENRRRFFGTAVHGRD